MSGWGGPNIDLPTMGELYDNFTYRDRFILYGYYKNGKYQDMYSDNLVISNIEKHGRKYKITFLTYDQGDMEYLTLKENDAVSYRVDRDPRGGRRKSRKRSHKKRATRRKPAKASGR